MTMKMIVTVSPAVGAGTGRSGDVARGDECSSWLTLLPFFAPEFCHLDDWYDPVGWHHWQAIPFQHH